MLSAPRIDHPRSLLRAQQELAGDHALVVRLPLDRRAAKDDQGGGTEDSPLPREEHLGDGLSVNPDLSPEDRHTRGQRAAVALKRGHRRVDRCACATRAASRRPSG
jgi:hypothetical protein